MCTCNLIYRIQQLLDLQPTRNITQLYSFMTLTCHIWHSLLYMIHYNVDYFFAGLFDIILPPRACELVWRFFVKIICHKTLVYLFNNNVLGFFILNICAIIVRSDVESQKDLAKEILLDNDTNLKTMYILKQPDQ